MNRATKITELPELTLDFLNAKGILIDKVFASLRRENPHPAYLASTILAGSKWNIYQHTFSGDLNYRHGLMVHIQLFQAIA